MTAADRLAGAILRRRVKIRNKKGLHARAAAKFVKTAGRFSAHIEVKRKDTTVSGLSIMGLMMLAAGPGVEIEVSARGQDAAGALDALVGLVKDGFGEE